jgi:hypothetical protein
MDKTSHKHDYKGNSPLALEQLDKYLQKQKEDEVLL